MIRGLLKPRSRSRAATAFDGRIPAPSLVSIATTRYCNLKCRMCLPFITGNTVKGPHMDLELFHRVADQVFPHVKRFQPSVAGEPTMSKGFMEMVRKAGRFGVKLEMTTNATLFSSPRLKSIVPALGMVVISFDGATKEVFENIRHGARFERVVENVRNLVRMAREMPESERPQVNLNCVIMHRNVHELPALVRLGHDMGADVVHFSHVYPETDEFRAESLVHFQDEARQFIAAAVAEARRLGQSLVVGPLDRVTAATASSSDPGRAVAAEGGVLPGFERQVVNPLPPAAIHRHEPDRDAAPEVREARASGRGARWFQPPVTCPRRRRGLPRKIQVCDYLWSRLYVGVQGFVTPCCVAGVPVVDRLDDGTSFETAWNNNILRQMRQRLALGDPAPVCRGCKHIRTVTEPAEIDRFLSGRPLPDAADLEPLPESLLEGSVGKPFDPQRLERDLAMDSPLPWGRGLPPDFEPSEQICKADGPPPTLRWPGRSGHTWRVVIAPLDDRGATHEPPQAGMLDTPALALSSDLWAELPPGRIAWHVTLEDDPQTVVYRGVIDKRT